MGGQLGRVMQLRAQLDNGVPLKKVIRNAMMFSPSGKRCLLYKPWSHTGCRTGIHAVNCPDFKLNQ